MCWVPFSAWHFSLGYAIHVRYSTCGNRNPGVVILKHPHSNRGEEKETESRGKSADPGSPGKLPLTRCVFHLFISAKTIHFQLYGEWRQYQRRVNSIAGQPQLCEVFLGRLRGSRLPKCYDVLLGLTDCHSSVPWPCEREQRSTIWVLSTRNVLLGRRVPIITRSWCLYINKQ